MRKQFIILILTAVLLILGWTIVEYLMQSQIQYQYQQLSSYPLMVYSWDKKLMTEIQEDFKQYKFIEKIVYKTSAESADEMIKKYGLSGAEDILQERTLPDMMIIYLKGSSKARLQKLILKDKLDKNPQIDRMMIEYQNDIWDLSFKRIDQLNQIRWILIGFIGIVIYLVFLLKRLHYEHHLARIKHLIKTKQTEGKVLHDHFWGNSLVLWLTSIGISFFAYQFFYYNDMLLYSIDAYFFLIELAVVLAATFTAYPFVVKYSHELPSIKEEND